jgi:hypothetical protein
MYQRLKCATPICLLARLAGTWQTTQMQLGQPLEEDIEPYDGDACRSSLQRTNIL